MESRIRTHLQNHYGTDVAERTRLDNLGGHASLRIYWRVHLPERSEAYERGEQTRIAMVLPQSADALKSEEATTSDAPPITELPFITVQRFMADIGLRVPAIDSLDMDLGVLLLEDLGDTMFENRYLAASTDEARVALYREAVELLVDYQSTVQAKASDEQLAYFTPKRFDAKLLKWELDHYVEWGLEAQYGADSIAHVRDELDTIFDGIVEKLVALPSALSLRDYQSRNIMYKNDEWVFIDFQDALYGPCVYDLVALLRDSYIVLAPDTVASLVGHYVETGRAAGLTWCEDEALVREAFALQTVQRKLKDSGRFIYIDQFKGNPDFLPYYEPSMGYVVNAVKSMPELSRLREILREVEPVWSKFDP